MRNRAGRLWRQTLEALFTTFAVLVASAFAAGAVMIALAFARPELLPDNAASLSIWFACGLTGVLATVLFALRRNSDAHKWAAMERRLESRATPDPGYYTHRLEIRKAARPGDFSEQFAHIPVGRSEAMIVLRQNASRNPREQGYELASMQDQLRRADDHLAGNPSPHVRWVCLTDRKGRFAGYQDFDSFRARVLFGNDTRYANALNSRDAGAFQQSIERFGPDLCRNAIVEGISRKGALSLMTQQGWESAMLVSRGDEKPVGVATLSALLRELLADQLDTADATANSDFAASADADIMTMPADGEIAETDSPETSLEPEHASGEAEAEEARETTVSAEQAAAATADRDIVPIGDQGVMAPDMPLAHGAPAAPESAAEAIRHGETAAGAEPIASPLSRVSVAADNAAQDTPAANVERDEHEAPHVDDEKPQAPKTEPNAASVGD